MYEEILIPTDGSDGSMRAVDHAIELAEAMDATLATLYVVDTTSADASIVQTLEVLEDAGQEVVEEIRDYAAEKGIDDVLTNVTPGTPHKTILAYAEEIDADVIVMGTHGRTGLNRYLLGSVTEKVVRSSDRPVVTVPITEDTERDEE